MNDCPECDGTGTGNCQHCAGTGNDPEHWRKPSA
jgi:hypothetical protein